LAPQTKQPSWAKSIIGVYLECPRTGQVFRLDAVEHSASVGDYHFGLHRCNGGESEGITLWVGLDRYNDMISVDLF